MSCSATTGWPTSPKKIRAYFDHVDKVEAPDKHTVVFKFKEFNAEWDYRFGWGYYSAIVPKEMVDAGASNWKNANGTGPFMLTDFVSGNSQHLREEPDLLGHGEDRRPEYKLPFVDKVIYRTIKDEATHVTALRTGKLDILEAIRWQNVDELKKSAPQLKWSNAGWPRAAPSSPCASTPKPFDDIRVRRALNMAVNKEEIVKRLLQRQRRAVRLSAASRLRPATTSRWRTCRRRSRSCSPTIPPRPRSCWPRPAIRTASPSRSRSAPAAPTTWICCRWSPPISRRSASRSRSSRWSTAPSSPR